MISVLKQFTARMIANKFTGMLIGLFLRDRIPFYLNTKILTENTLIDNKIKAMLFFRLYEGYESRSVIKYLLPNDTVIELGGSIGAVSTLIGKKIAGGRLFVVEANKDLLPAIEENLSFNKIQNYKLINGCIGDETSNYFFVASTMTTHGYITDNNVNGSLRVEGMSLSSIIKREKISEFVLVCDIEGSEADLVFKDSISLDMCKLIIIETHNTERNNDVYRSSDIRDRIINLGFKCVEENGVNFVFKKDTADEK